MAIGLAFGKHHNVAILGDDLGVIECMLQDLYLRHQLPALVAESCWAAQPGSMLFLTVLLQNWQRTHSIWGFFLSLRQCRHGVVVSTSCYLGAKPHLPVTYRTLIRGGKLLVLGQYPARYTLIVDVFWSGN